VLRVSRDQELSLGSLDLNQMRGPENICLVGPSLGHMQDSDFSFHEHPT
jgi:hypothetical protein